MTRRTRYRSFAAILAVGLMVAVLAPFAAASQPGLVRSPLLGPRGTHVTISGTGFRPNEAVDVYFDRADMALGVADADGSFGGVKIAVPEKARVGSHWVSAVGRASHETVQRSFDVTPTRWGSWPQAGRDAGRTGYVADETSLNPGSVGGLRRSWTAGERYQNSVLIVGRTLVVEGYGPEGVASIISAFDAWTGASLWSVDVTYPTAIAAWGDLVLAASNGRLTAYDVGTGAVRWSARVGPYRSALWSGFAVDGDVAYMAQDSDAGHRPPVLTAFDLAAVRTRWSTPLGDGSAWVGASVVSDGVAVVSVGQGLVGVGTESGAVRWSKPWILGWSGSLAADAGTVYASASSREELLAISAVSGRVVWRAPLAPGEWISGAATDGVRLYAPYGPWEDAGPTGLRAYDVATGHMLWSRASSSRPGVPTVANGLVYSATSHSVTVLAAASGRVVHGVSLAADLWQQPIVANATVYLPAEAGVIALRPPGAVQPAVASLSPDGTLVPGAGHEVRARTTGWTSSPGLDRSLGTSVVSTAELDGVLYLGTKAAPDGSAAVLRTSDGSTFEAAVRFPDVASVRLTTYRGRLYAATKGSRGASLYVSSDARTFTLVPGIDTGSIHGITPLVWRDGLLLLADTTTGPQVWASEDGVTFARATRTATAAGDATFAVDPTGRGAVLYRGALYLGTRSPSGGELWRTIDGSTLQRVATDGLGRAANTALVPQLVHRGRLYVLAEGEGGLEIFWTSNGTAFERTVAEGFHAGLDRNLTGELASISGRLVLATGNRKPVGGSPPIEIVRSFGLRVYVSEDGARWRRVAASAFADPHDWTGSVLVVDGSLYLAGTNQREGDGVWRSADGITWTLSFREPTGAATGLGSVLVLYDGHLLVLHGDSAAGIGIWRSEDAVVAAPPASTPLWEWAMLTVMLVSLVAMAALAAQAYRENRTGPPRHAHAA
jgi:hypothetical protein